MSVFEGLTGPALLATGRTVNIIDATPENFDQVREFYETLGAKSSHFRFFGMRKTNWPSRLSMITIMKESQPCCWNDSQWSVADAV